MNKFRLFVSVFTIFILIHSFFACTKDEKKETQLFNNNQTIESRGSGDLLDLIGVDCFNFAGTTPNCNDIPYTDTLTFTDLPNYPGCTFKIIYRYYVCGGFGGPLAGLTDLSISDYQILEHDCQKFSDEIETKRNTTIWSEFIHQFDVKIHDQIQTHLINTWMQGGDYRCGSGLLFSIKFFSSSCYQYCTAQTKFGKENGKNLFISTKVACGLQCCETHTRICRKPDGSIQTEVLIAPIYPPFCQDESLLSNSYNCLLRGENVWMSQCTFNTDICIP